MLTLKHHFLDQEDERILLPGRASGSHFTLLMGLGGGPRRWETTGVAAANSLLSQVSVVVSSVFFPPWFSNYFVVPEYVTACIAPMYLGVNKLAGC